MLAHHNLSERIRIHVQTILNFRPIFSILHPSGEEMDVGSGRTMETNEGDTIFVYYSDHGNNDILAFPYGSVLRARDLNAAIVSMHEKKR